MYGGGTHENLNGSELDQHVDFNYNDLTKEHRRLNLLIYLNPVWHEDWGGALELHSDPRNPKANEIIAFAPIFNRAVLMETTETSWHGFPRINIPKSSSVRSRKSLALYFYSKKRPADDVAGGHGTFYVHRLPPKEFFVGSVISQNCFDDINHLIAKRDAFLSLYQEREKEQALRMASVTDYNHFLLSKIRLPIYGMAMQCEVAEGYAAEGFIGLKMCVRIKSLSQITSVTLKVYARESLAYPLNLDLSFNDDNATRFIIPSPGQHTIDFGINIPNDLVGLFCIKASDGKSGADEGVNEDQRVFSVLIESIGFL